MNNSADPATDKLVRTMLVALFAMVVLRSGWVGDDAYITLRTVDNFVNGRGLVWNLSERVQVYTHPLWMFVLSGLYAITHEGFYTLMWPGLVFSVIAVLVVSRWLVPPGPAGWLMLALFILSRAFVDYSTSGLENPLSHLLLAIALTLWYTRPPSARTVLLVSATCGLATLNRLDMLLLHAPIVVAVVLEARRNGARWGALAARVLAGMLPMVAWEVFSLVYYGALVPNTALAKLNTGIPRSELVEQGLFYLLNVVECDPLTALVLCLGFCAPVITRDRRDLPPALGAGLYLAYVVSVGGDFMSGRFVTAPFLAGVVLMARVRLPTTGAVVAVAFVAAAAAFSAQVPTLGPVNAVSRSAGSPDRRGIADERSFFVRKGNSLRLASRTADMPNHPWRGSGETLPQSRIAVLSAAGMRAWAAAPSLYAVDRPALTNPFLARLPAARNSDWRVGHYHRALPPGYIETLTSNRDAFEDPQLSSLFTAVQTVTRGRIFSRDRFREIWRLNTDYYPIDVERYRYPDALVATAQTPGDPSNGSLERADLTEIGQSGVYVDLGRERKERYVQLWRRADLDAEVLFYKDGEVVGQTEIDNHLPKGAFIVDDYAEVPRRVQHHGFDALRVLPLRGPTPWCFLAVDVTPKRSRMPVGTGRALLPPKLVAGTDLFADDPHEVADEPPPAAADAEDHEDEASHDDDDDAPPLQEEAQEEVDEEALATLPPPDRRCGPVQVVADHEE